MTDRSSFWNQPLEPDPVVEAYKKDVDRTLIRENLKLTHEERLRRLMSLQRFTEELQRAGRSQK
ncbi:hypothetical protein GC175_12495 [bacterium]|nr:hypothetical protein [bacterium]